MKKTIHTSSPANASPIKRGPGSLRGERGMALVLTLMILVFITAMVVEFSYGVFTSTSALHNWKEAQRLSFAAKSGVSLAVKTIADPQVDRYKFPGKMAIPVENILEGFTGSVVVTVEDENAKFNLNSLRIDPNVTVFRNLLGSLGLDENIAYRVADWIDVDSDSRLKDSEQGAKNAYMDSVDELLLIKGIDYRTYAALLPYVTVYGYDWSDIKQGDGRVNINTASIPVIMSLNGSISKAQADEVVNRRKLQPLKTPGDVTRAGIDSGLISRNLGFDPQNFRITVVAEENGIKRVVETVVKVSGSSQVLYWREM
jgi:general secretion pathway protein K